MTYIKRLIAWLLEDTSVAQPQPIDPRRMVFILHSERVDRMTAREWLGRWQVGPGPSSVTGWVGILVNKRLAWNLKLNRLQLDPLSPPRRSISPAHKIKVLLYYIPPQALCTLAKTQPPRPKVSLQFPELSPARYHTVVSTPGPLSHGLK